MSTPNPSEMIERMRELQRDWHGMRGEDTQLSLLTGDEISATVDSVPSSGNLQEERNSAMRPKMLPPLTDCDPGDETDYRERVSWDD